MNKTTDLLLCIFLGPLGAHKFYEGKIGTGILYLFTVGLFCVGWISDIIKKLSEFSYSSQEQIIDTDTSTNNYKKHYSYSLENTKNSVLKKIYSSSKYEDEDYREIYIEPYADDTKLKVFLSSNNDDIGDIIKPEYVKEIIDNDLDYGFISVNKAISNDGIVSYSGKINFYKY